jgi:hypothetical protein
LVVAGIFKSLRVWSFRITNADRLKTSQTTAISLVL